MFNLSHLLRRSSHQYGVYPSRQLCCASTNLEIGSGFPFFFFYFFFPLLFWDKRRTKLGIVNVIVHFLFRGKKKKNQFLSGSTNLQVVGLWCWTRGSQISTKSLEEVFMLVLHIYFRGPKEGSGRIIRKTNEHVRRLWNSNRLRVWLHSDAECEIPIANVYGVLDTRAYVTSIFQRVEFHAWKTEIWHTQYVRVLLAFVY